MSVVMVCSVMTCIFTGVLFSFLVAFHLVLSIGELVASVDLVDYERRSPGVTSLREGHGDVGFFCFLWRLKTSGASGSFRLVKCWGIFVPPQD